MALKIKLSRFGATHKPMYRVVVAEARSRRDGDAVEQVGTYQPRTAVPPAKLKLDRVDYWISKGAIPTDTVRGLINKARREVPAETATPAAAS
jgi:small subunit ribosomal protein S16